MFLNLDQQLLVYIKVKRDIRKSRVINTIQIGIFLFSRMKKLMMFSLLGSRANDIIENIVHTTHAINNMAKKNHLYIIGI